MPDLAIGDQMSLSPDQLAIITGAPSGTLPSGHVFSWRKGRFRVEESTPSSCRIVRLAANDRGAETAVQQPKNVNERDAWVSPTPPAGADVDQLGVVPVTGPVDPSSLVTPRGYPVTDPSREVVDDLAGGLAGPPSGPSLDVEKKREYQPHPHIQRSPQDPARETGLPGGEPVDQSLGYAGRSDPRTILDRMFLYPEAISGTVRS